MLWQNVKDVRPHPLRTHDEPFGIKIGQQYVHSHRMERSPWWAEWWTYISAGQVRKGKPRKQAKKVGTNLGTEANVISMAVLQ